MHVFKSEQAYIVRLDVGEEIIATLGRFAAEVELAAAALSGIGAVKNTVLGYFDLHRKAYSQCTFAEDMELVSLAGNVTWVDDAPLIHAHATLAGPDYAVVGGHLFSAEIAVTGEIYVAPLATKIFRGLDERTGLKLIRA